MGMANKFPENLLLGFASSSYQIEGGWNENGEIGLSLTMVWKEPKTDGPEDAEAAAESIQFNVGWFGHPIFSEKGDYPDIMKKKIGEKSKLEGRTKSRLPEFDQYWINYIKGTADFFGLNHYFSLMACHEKSTSVPGKHLRAKSLLKDDKTILFASPEWEKGNSWLYVVPWGFRKCLRWIKENYKNPKIYITENGFPDKGTLEDIRRISFFQGYLKEMLKSIRDDGCRVGVYTAWSLLDNFEWEMGYTERFGIIHVDFNDPGRKRFPKKSYKYFKDIYKTRCLPDDLKEYSKVI